MSTETWPKWNNKEKNNLEDNNQPLWDTQQLSLPLNDNVALPLPPQLMPWWEQHNNNALNMDMAMAF